MSTLKSDLDGLRRRISTFGGRFDLPRRPQGLPDHRVARVFDKVKHLEELDLRETRIAELPLFIRTLKSLKKLDHRSVAMLSEFERPYDFKVTALRN